MSGNTTEYSSSVDPMAVAPARALVSPGTNQDDSTDALNAALLFGISFPICLIIAVIVFLLIKRQKSSAEKTDMFKKNRNEEITRYLMDKNYDWDFTQLWLEAKLLFSPTASESVHLDYLRTIILDNPEANLSEIATVIMKTRYAIPCTLASIVVPDLHMNKLADWFNDPVYLAMAPLPAQFVRFWSVILSENIGIIVLIGPYKENNSDVMDPYMPLELGQTVTYGTTRVKTTFVESGTHDQTRMLDVSSANQKSRMITAVHLTSWYSMADVQYLDLVAGWSTLIEKLHIKAKGRRLPGVLLHDSTGLFQAPALLSIYIGTQLFRDRSRLNIVGVMKYICRQRYGCFSIVPCGERLVPLIYGVIVLNAHAIINLSEPSKSSKAYDLFPESTRIYSSFAKNSSVYGSADLGCSGKQSTSKTKAKTSRKAINKKASVKGTKVKSNSALVSKVSAKIHEKTAQSAKKRLISASS